MHVKVQHPGHFKEFQKNYDALRKTSVRREIVPGKKKQAPRAREPAPEPARREAPQPPRSHHAPPPPGEKVQVKEVPAPGPAPRVEETVKAPGGEAPQAGQGGEKSFLEELSDGFLGWLNSP